MAVDLSRGNFNQRVTIKSVVKEKDDSSGHDEDYPSEITTWCVVDHKGGNRTFSEGNMIVFDRKDFYITWRSAFSAIDEDTIFIHDGIEYKYQARSFVTNVKHIVKFETIGA